MRITTLTLGILISFFDFGQSQIGNSDMELWDMVGAPTEEPKNWNSFKTGSGSFAGFANKQIEQSTNVRSGATGLYCARVWSTSVLGIVANGSMTLGQVNMGSTTPANALNYNYSKTSDPNFSEEMLDAPDSIVFWVKYTQAGTGNQEARMHAILHDAYDVHDPIDANSQPHIIATAGYNYSQTNGEWVRKSVPFTYEVTTGLVPGFILVTFAANAVPGGGAANDEILIDDIELIYNGNNVDENAAFDFLVNYDAGILNLFGQINGSVKVSNLQGDEVYSGPAAEHINLNLKTGIYFISIIDQKGSLKTCKFVAR